MPEKKKILLIEDERILAEMYEQKFIKAGFDVDLALSAEDGIEMIKKGKPDLILLDILLPEQNGVAFLQWLKDHSKNSSVPIIAFSNYDDPKTMEKAKKLGVKEYLLKANYTPGEIVEKIKSYFK
ncbi:MAG: response regulator [Candidatus Nealsonbacteria bacterium]|nr:response regulator [Candidatus Nealsonbacteria bacterium]